MPTVKSAPQVTRKSATPATRAKTSAAIKEEVAVKPSRKPARSRPATIPVEQRRHYVEVAAYYIAERRGFDGSSELEDWLQAEIEVDQMLASGRLNT